MIWSKNTIHLSDGVCDRETSDLVDGFVRDEIEDIHRQLSEEHLRRRRRGVRGESRDKADERWEGKVVTLMRLAMTLTSVQPSYSPWSIWFLILWRPDMERETEGGKAGCGWGDERAEEWEERRCWDAVPGTHLSQERDGKFPPPKEERRGAVVRERGGRGGRYHVSIVVEEMFLEHC
jgi:hypothetical protein